MAIGELQRRSGVSPSWLIEIDGIGQRYYSGFPPAASAVPAPFTAVFADVQARISPQTLDLKKAIVEDGAASIRLIETRSNGMFANLLRIQPTFEATLITTVPASTGATTVTVLEDLTPWPAAGQIWIGQECMNYTARTLFAPFQFTVPAGGNRGYFGSQVQEHRVESAEGWAPKVTGECVAWRGRRARLKLAAGRRDGQTPDDFYITVVEGFLDQTPSKNDLLSASFVIVPNTAKLEREVGGEETETGLQHGWHAWDVNGENVFGGQYRVHWADGGLYEQKLTAATIFPGPGPITVDDVEALTNVNDFVTTTISVHFKATPALPMVATGTVVAAPGPGGTITTAPVAGRDIGAEVWVRAFDEPKEEIDVSVVGGPGPVLTKWPGPAIEAIHTVTAVGSIATAAGRRVSMRIIPASQGGNSGATVNFRTNTTQNPMPPEIRFERDPNGLWYGIDFRPPGTPPPSNLFALDGDAQLHELGWWDRFSEQLVQGGAGGVAALSQPIRGVADAFHQNNSKMVWVEDNVFRTPSAASPVWIRVRWNEGDVERLTHVQVESVVAASTIDITAPGFILTTPDSSLGFHESFGDWPGEGRARIRELVRWRDKSPTRIMLDLLLSGQGNFINHPTYDRLPFGANLDQAEVDVSSFEDYPVPPVALRQTLTIEEDAIKIADIFAPLLRLMGAVIVPRLNQVTGARKLTLVQISAPTTTDSRRTIADGGWAVSDRPTTESDDEVVNLINYRLNYDREDKPRLTVRIADRDSIARYEVGASEEELRGMTLPSEDPESHRQALLQIALATFSEIGRPRRVSTATVAASDALLLDAGGVVVMTASDVNSLTGSLGVTSVPARVMSKQANWSKNEAELTVRLYDYTATGWAPALEVSALGPGPNEVTVAPGGFVNAFTTADHPITGEPQTDLDYWAIGDVARAVPAGNYAASVAGLVVTAISATTITFGAPPGLAIGDTIRPDDYGPASTDHETNYAFLASDAGLLAAVDPAKSYA